MLLEAVPTIWGKSQTSELCKLYLELCKHTKVPGARAQALRNLAQLLDDHIYQDKLQDLPAPEEFEPFQRIILDSINQVLANAVILASGPIMAIQALPHNGQLSFFMFEQRLRAWGKTVADALHESNTFDMRMAAAMAIRSFAAAVRSAAANDAAYLPFLLALYNTLVDDDDEIRDVGAAATALVTSSDPHARSSQPLVAVDAADALLSWLRERFGHTHEFRAYVACRLVGDPLIALDIGVQDLTAWASPNQQLARALEVDESLFAVEEQNLFIDQVRETERWADVFRALPRDYDQTEGDDGVAGKVLIMDSSLDALKAWVERALEALAAQFGQDDGPLGWASRADAFALCHRVIICGKIMAELLGEEDTVIASSLARLKDIGKASRLHGLLLSALDRV
ncbi:putative heat repeat protein [Diaporthe ampelina]|uniref:Putative heat repeat protein n=1 Tax=Diaporthe ampelina TaxID=1214573 RepID=A0A0G2FFH9_9PEZI|nr:putative heat repeat protein [Diaporthe ampelina]